MLHELLLALLGYTGDLIIDDRDEQKSLGVVHFSPESPISEDSTFKLAPDISSIQPSDRDVIERLIPLGFHFREFGRLATNSRDLSWIRSSKDFPPLPALLKGKTNKPSVYRRAIANGIVEILLVYRSAILHVEQKLLSDPTPILAMRKQDK